MKSEAIINNLFLVLCIHCTISFIYTLMIDILTKSLWKYQYIQNNWCKNKKLTVLPAASTFQLCLSSFMFIIIVVLAYINQIYDCFVVLLIVWINSMNYWRYPLKYNYRRKLDIISSVVGILYHGFVSLQVDDYGSVYRYGIIYAFLWYMMSEYFHSLDKLKSATFSHLNVHSAVIIFNLLFFRELRICRNQ